MLLDIDHHCGVPIYKQIVEQIRQQVLSRHLNTGDQLTSVRDLAKQLSVNPMTISKAYNLLESDGLVERKRGIGLFIAPMKEKITESIKTQKLQQVFDKAATMAVQFDVPEQEAIEIFKNLYQKNKKRG